MQRSVSEVIRSIQAMEGAGVPIRRVFPTAALEDVDPFLLLDHLGPIEFRPG
jgi:quercetin 2,3-dioxygenase